MKFARVCSPGTSMAITEPTSLSSRQQGTPPLVELVDVDYTQGGQQILRDVAWQLATGEHWAVLGPNGSGKTTLLKIACGYLWPTGGRVVRGGEQLVDLREWRTRVGWISSELVAQVPKRDTALETVVTGRTSQVGLRYLPNFAPNEQQFAEARDRLATLGCESLIDKPFGVLSQGERQQVLVARAQMAHPVLLVLDEPCAGMDPGVRERFLAWLDGVLGRADGPATLLVTHHVEEIMPHLERTMMLSEGRIVRQGPTGEVLRPEVIESAYGIRLAELRETGGRRWPIWHGD